MLRPMARSSAPAARVPLVTLLVWVTIASAGSAQSPGWSPRHAFVPGGGGRGGRHDHPGRRRGPRPHRCVRRVRARWGERRHVGVGRLRVDAAGRVPRCRRLALVQSSLATRSGGERSCLAVRILARSSCAATPGSGTGRVGNRVCCRSRRAPRERHGIVFDAARGRILLHGGRTGVSSSGGDTWEYDGVTWTLLTPANGPASRDGHQLAYDNARQRVVMFGGYQAPQNETWEWDGTTWLAITTARGAAASRQSRLAL
jgi:hypothetical protein